MAKLTLSIQSKTNEQIGYQIGWDLQDLTLLIEELSKRLDKKNETS